MLDVLHFYFEEDNTFTSEDQASSRSKLRERIYSEWFNKPYKYKYTSSSESKKSNNFIPADYETEGMETMSDEESAIPFDPLKPANKSPLGMDSVTPFDPNADNPFGGILDAPAGH